MLKQTVQILNRVDAGIQKVEGWALIIILGVMMTVAFAQVVLRNFFSMALSWGDGLTRALVLWAGLLGASMAVREGRYINIDAFSRLLNDNAKRWTRGVIYVFSTVTCVFLGLAAVDFVKAEKIAATSYSIGVQSWIVELVIPFVFFFIAFRFVIKTLMLLAGYQLEKHEWER